MKMESMYEQLGVSAAVYEYGERIIAELRDRFDTIDQTAEYNQAKVLSAMQKNRVNATHFAATTGYGYDDEGRDNLERVYADVFHTEAALVRPQITCGTHALTVALSANLLPGDELLSPVGAPYDTLEEVIGIRESKCSLKEYGVTYAQANLKADGTFDYDAIRSKINERTKLITIQRSKGYATRPSFSVEQIGELIRFCKEIKPDVKVMVDNCYGEFVERIEPSDMGADMVVGSLIKNPGGGLAPIGGYICGTKECVERCAYRLSAPGLGQEVGANLGLMPALYQGFFLAPTVVSGALKGAIFAANIYEKLGYFVGKTMVLRVLRGSRDKRILELGLDQISTYNLMHEKRQELNALCDFLEADGYLRVNPEHSTLEPEERARDVLFRGKQLLMPVLASPEPAPKASQKGAKKQTAPLPSGADDLFGVLRETRMKIAQRENVPAYIVCSNSTLLDMAEKAPETMDALLSVSGIGEVKACRYGEDFLSAIRNYQRGK